MAANAGIRDGDFVRFPNWDAPQNDVAYYPKLKGNIAALKKIMLQKQGEAFYAFNTNGWVKSWDTLDYSKFSQSSGSDLYVRVEYPGWYFLQGMDSGGNDIEQITEVSTATGLRDFINGKYRFDNKIAAFNTAGWVKTKVTYPLTKVNYTAGSVGGTYVRTKFRDFCFFPKVDSPGNDIGQTPNAKDDVPALIRADNALTQSAGFNTLGWHKSHITVPPTVADVFMTEPYQGFYARCCWPDFIHLPGLDSPYNDIRKISNVQVFELIKAARNDPTAVAVNTSGWLKNNLVDNPVDFPGADKLQGIYVKDLPLLLATLDAQPGTRAVNDNVLLQAAFFSLKGTVIIWTRWLLKDNSVRLRYQASVNSATREILDDITARRLTPLQGATRAVNMRNSFLLEMRDISSPPGILVARILKPAGGTVENYLNKNAKRRYGKNFGEIDSNEQRNQVAIDTVESAGRANPGVTNVIRVASRVCQALTVIGVATSMLSIYHAEEWETELGHQVESWSGSIIGGQLGAGVGAIVGPIGAILGGIIGSILGGVGGAALGDWFFGGSSSSRAVDLLSPVLQLASELVGKRMTACNVAWYTHHIRVAHVSVYSSRSVSQAAETIEEMLTDIPVERGALSTNSNESEILATIVWIPSLGANLPNNAANPADMIALMHYVARNLPG